MKKLSLIMVFALLLATFSACGGGGDPSSDGGSGASGGQYVIANTPKCVGISWLDRMLVGNDRFMEST